MMKKVAQEIPKKAKPLEPTFKLKEFDKEMIVASYFGFTPIISPEVTDKDITTQKTVKDPYYNLGYIEKEKPFAADIVEKIALIRAYQEWGLNHEPHPLLITYHKPIQKGARKKPGESSLGLEIIGLQSSSAEALLIRTCLSILQDEGYTNLSIRLNSLGDKESINDYERMISGYVRKNINAMTPELRKLVKQDIFEVIRTKDPKCEHIHNDAPKSMSFLSESARIHFKEVLEYVESFDIPYTIRTTLINSPSFCSQTQFEIISENEKGEENVLASGFCYSRLTKKLGMKRELPSFGATLCFKKKNTGTIVKTFSKPRFYLIQLGFQGKMKSLHVIDILRKAKIPVTHALAKDKLQSQLGSAENTRVTHVLIIGQKEAIENSVTVRDMNTRVQETVPISGLISYLKGLKS